MEEPLTQNSTVLKCSLAVHIYSTPGNKQLEHQRPASFRPSRLLSKPTMKHQAEINRFAILLFCSLVPLGSLAPMATSEESKSTTGQRQKHFITRIKPLASVIEKQATTLFKNYNACSSVTPKTVRWLTADSQAKKMVQKITGCPAFDADCCIFHTFYNILRNLRSDIEFICGEDLTRFVDANINQLHVTLSERAALYTCKNKDLPQMDRGQVQRMNTAEKKMYIWWVLQKYEQIMQNTTKMYSSAEIKYSGVEKITLRYQRLG